MPVPVLQGYREGEWVMRHRGPPSPSRAWHWPIPDPGMGTGGRTKRTRWRGERGAGCASVAAPGRRQPGATCAIDRRVGRPWDSVHPSEEPRRGRQCGSRLRPACSPAVPLDSGESVRRY
jgi:hypothetical protein